VEHGALQHGFYEKLLRTLDSRRYQGGHTWSRIKTKIGELYKPVLFIEAAIQFQAVEVGIEFLNSPAGW
jgi:hypothetical protein